MNPILCCSPAAATSETTEDDAQDKIHMLVILSLMPRRLDHLRVSVIHATETQSLSFIQLQLLAKILTRFRTAIIVDEQQKFHF